MGASSSEAFSVSVARMVKAFDADGGWTVDTGKTRLVSASDEKEVEAIIALRNNATGQVFDRKYIGMQDIQSGLGQLSILAE